MYFLLIINAGTTGRMKKVTALGYSKVLQGKVKKLDQKYPDKSRRIQKLLSELSEMEKSGEKTLTKWRAVSEKLWKRFLHGNRMYGKILCAEWDFSWQIYLSSGCIR